MRPGRGGWRWPGHNKERNRPARARLLRAPHRAVDRGASPRSPLPARAGAWGLHIRLDRSDSTRRFDGRLGGVADIWRNAVDRSTRFRFGAPSRCLFAIVRPVAASTTLRGGEREGQAMDLGIKGRKAIVNGGSAGMGRSAALWLAREGVDVFVSARGEQRLARACREIAGETGATVVPICADHSSAEGRDAILSAC